MVYKDNRHPSRSSETIALTHLTGKKKLLFMYSGIILSSYTKITPKDA
jgi:hypothetical protein